MNKRLKDSRGVALRHLEHRDRTCREMRQYLESKGYLEKEIDDTISYLLDMKYLCDESYVKKYVDYASSKGKGSLKIKAELHKKGIDNELINETLNSCETFEVENESSRAMAQALKIMRTVEDDILPDFNDDFNTKSQKYKELQKIKAKIARRLNSLGYSHDVIFLTINEVFNYDANDNY